MNEATTRAIATTLLLPALLALPLQAQGLLRRVDPVRKSVWTVDAAGGADFRDLPQAVAAARSGDVVLVAPGDYTAFDLVGKGLTIVGNGGLPRVEGRTSIRGLGPGEIASLRSLELLDFFGPSSTGAALTVEGNLGTVWLEEIRALRGPAFEPEVLPDAALLVENSAAVVVVRCEILSETAAVPLPSFSAAEGMVANGSSVQAFDSTFAGADTEGITGVTGPLRGGDGATLEDTALYAAGCTFRGGRGSPSSFNAFGNFCVQEGGMGGNGLDAQGAGTPAITLDCAFARGPAGLIEGTCTTQGPGSSTLGNVTREDLPLRSYELSSPAAGGASNQLTATCEPGELVWSVLSAELAPVYVPLYFGPMLGSLPSTLVFEGAADASGILQKTVPVPPLTGFSGFERAYVQGLFFDDLGNAYLGSPSQLLVPRQAPETPGARDRRRRSRPRGRRRRQRHALGERLDPAAPPDSPVSSGLSSGDSDGPPPRGAERPAVVLTAATPSALGTPRLRLHSSTSRYPTPCSVSRNLGRAGSSSILRLRFATKTRT